MKEIKSAEDLMSEIKALTENTDHSVHFLFVKIKELMQSYNAAQFQTDGDGWVKVEDSEDWPMPPFEEKTQIICADGEQYIGYFNGADRKGHCWFCDNNDYHYPTHYRFLPSKPKQ